MKRTLGAAALVLALGLSSALADNAVQSGPQVGDNARPKPFFPLNINGPEASKKSCLVCRNGDNPVVMIFAREISSPLTALIKKVDEVNVKNKAARMGSFAIFCSDADGLDKKLKDLAETEKLKEFVLAIDNPSGPTPYKIAKDADVTVVLYNKSKVLANFTFKKGELSEKSVESILTSVPKILQ